MRLKVFSLNQHESVRKTARMSESITGIIYNILILNG
jgi:hypothetical protein